MTVRRAGGAGTHLQIAYKVNQPTDVNDFRKLVDELLTNAPAARRDPTASVAQFRRVRNLMVRFHRHQPRSPPLARQRSSTTSPTTAPDLINSSTTQDTRRPLRAR
jgi:hypothetical protein